MLWKKEGTIADWVTRFTVGEDYRWDTKLIKYDILGTLAHAEGLLEIGILSQDELNQITQSLEELTQLVEQGKVTVRPVDEDCHTVIEQFLTKILGETGKKIHTGRSRNDQVLTALRLYMRDQLHEIGHRLSSIVESLCQIGKTYDKSLMPGYTHFQRAMPTTAGLWAMGYAELLLGDLSTLLHSIHFIDQSPLGSAAGYGVPFLPLQRQKNASRLGFKGMQTNVTAVQLSRGKLELQAIHALVQISATFNRMASDLILYNTSEFQFVTLPVEFCTGSSIMPQKKNPDVLELVRAYYHRLIAEMNVLLTLPANLPSGYHRDLQLTKESIMRSLIITLDIVNVMDTLIPHLSFNIPNMKNATTPEMFATHRALKKVLTGTSFRQAYKEAAVESEQGGLDEEITGLDDYMVNGYPGRSDIKSILDALEELKTYFN